MTFTKSIIIIGGGISGLSVLHYLKKKYPDTSSVKILLLEKNAELGGTVKTEYHRDWVFEHGPNGFLNRGEPARHVVEKAGGQALLFIEELGLKDQLITAHSASSQRFIAIQDKLHLVPTGPMGLLRFKPLSIFDKLRIPLEIFVRRGHRGEETVYEFGKRRFGKNVSKVFLDPLVNGIYAGDVRRLNLQSAFPKIYEIEQKHGSLLKGMIRLAKSRSGRAPQESTVGRLFSFKGGMSQLIEAFYSRYKEHILLKEEAASLYLKGEQFVVGTPTKNLLADGIFLCVPANQAACLVKPVFPLLSFQLEKIEYAPVSVVGLVYRKKAFTKIPEGFGYLIPSWEKKEVLGVLFENQIFPHRSDDQHVVLRIMMGGCHHPDVVSRTPAQLTAMAQEEIQWVLGAREDPIHVFIKIWPRAIPQYNSEDLPVRSIIEKELRAIKNFFIVSNYLGGVSFADCVCQAQMVVNQIKI